VLSYQTGPNHWRHLDKWPLAPASTPLYLHAGGKLGFDKPAGEKAVAAFDEYVSDPAKPVPFVQRPVRMGDGNVWRPWLVSDQRAWSGRPDVLSWTSEPLKAPLSLAGQPLVNLVASTSGTDSDWVVKLIDVYPDEVARQPELGGYQLAVSMDIFRGRYVDGFDKPHALVANKPTSFKFALPNVDHVFLPGHRIMVQVQSSWFPLYDRNPQTYVPNMFYASPADYKKATQRVYHDSVIELPVVK
jgi:uncharacterized protein